MLGAEKLLYRNITVCLPCLCNPPWLFTVGWCHYFTSCVGLGWPSACLTLWHFKMSLATTYVDHRWLLCNWLPKMLHWLLNPESLEIKKSQKWASYPGVSLHNTNLKLPITTWRRSGWEFRNRKTGWEKLRTSHILMEIRKIDGIGLSSTWRYLNLGVYMWSRCLNSPSSTR